MQVFFCLLAIHIAYFKATKLKLADKGRLTARSQMVFTEVFYRFAHSQPGTMSPEELNMLQVSGNTCPPMKLIITLRDKI